MQLDTTPQTFIKGTIEYSKLPVSKLMSLGYNLLSLNDSVSDALLRREAKEFRGVRSKISMAKKMFS